MIRCWIIWWIVNICKYQLDICWFIVYGLSGLRFQTSRIGISIIWKEATTKFHGQSRCIRIFPMNIGHFGTPFSANDGKGDALSTKKNCVCRGPLTLAEELGVSLVSKTQSKTHTDTCIVYHSNCYKGIARRWALHLLLKHDLSAEPSCKFHFESDLILKKLKQI